MLHFKWIGESNKPIVVLLHGLFGMGDNLSALAKALMNDFYVLLLDLPNHGASFHQANSTYPAMAGAVLEVIEQLHIEQYHLFGHSMGGKVAMQLTQHHANKIKSLVIADIAPVDYVPLHQAIIDQMLKVDQAGFKTRKEVDNLLAESIEAPFLRQFLMKNMQRSEAGFFRWQLGIDNIASSYINLCLAPELKTPFTNPTLFVKGENSDYIVDQYKKDVVTFFPNLSLKVIQGAGHWLHFDKPVIFNRLVLQFFLKQA